MGLEGGLIWPVFHLGVITWAGFSKVQFPFSKNPEKFGPGPFNLVPLAINPFSPGEMFPPNSGGTQGIFGGGKFWGLSPDGAWDCSRVKGAKGAV